MGSRIPARTAPSLNISTNENQLFIRDLEIIKLEIK